MRELNIRLYALFYIKECLDKNKDALENAKIRLKTCERGDYLYPEILKEVKNCEESVVKFTREHQEMRKLVEHFVEE